LVCRAACGFAIACIAPALHKHAMRIFEMKAGSALKERLRVEHLELLDAARTAIETCRFETALACCAEIIARDGVGRLDLLRENGRLAKGPEGLRYFWRIEDLPFATGIFDWVAKTLLYLERDIASFEPVFDDCANAFFATIADAEPITTPAQIWVGARPWLDAAMARAKPWYPVDGRIKRA